MKSMRFFRLFGKMLRFPMPFMLLIPFMLGTMSRGRFAYVPGQLWAILALLSCYVVASSVNDIADKDIDAVNIPNDPERPLLTGEASVKDLWILQSLAMIIAVGAAIMVGKGALWLVLAALTVDYAYSLPPLRLSRFPIFAPVVLSAWYVLFPYWLGSLLAPPKGMLQMDTRLFLRYMAPALMLLCFSRVLLKDFRDRKGDAAHGKTTFLLRYGKGATCLTSVLAVVAGAVTLIWHLRLSLPVEISLALYFVPIILALDALWLARTTDDERAAIQVATRLSTAVGIVLLGLFVLQGAYATWISMLIFTWGFFLVFALRHPESLMTVYRLVFRRRPAKTETPLT